MIVLSSTDDSIEVVLSATINTVELDCFASWRERTDATFKASRSIENTTGTSYKELVPPPSIADKQTVVDYISIFNTDSKNHEVTIVFNDGASRYVLFKTILGIGEKVEYQEGQGFKVISNNGSVKQSINQGNNSITSSLSNVVLGSNVINNNATADTMNDVTGLNFACAAGKTYYFKFIIPYTAQATTTGSRWGVLATAGLATNLSMISEYSLTSTTTTRNANVQGFDLPAASNATSASTTNNVAFMEGYFTPTANCNLKARFASEVSASAITALAGAVVYFQQLN